MKKFCALRNNRLSIFLSALSVFGWIAVPCLWADPWKDAVKRAESEETSFLGRTIGLYQKFLSGADGKRCPMYPSCSAYAKQAFHTHGALKGWILTSDRLLRCGHDEVKLSGRKKIKGQYVTPDPLEKNDFLFR